MNEIFTVKVIRSRARSLNKRGCHGDPCPEKCFCLLTRFRISLDDIIYDDIENQETKISSYNYCV